MLMLCMHKALVDRYATACYMRPCRLPSCPVSLYCVQVEYRPSCAS